MAALAGREPELQQISAALDSASSRTSVVLLFNGTAGIGKSALLQAAVYEAHQRQFTTVFVDGDETGSQPLGLPRGVVDALSDDASRSPHIFDDALNALRTAAADAPVLLAIDRLESIDDASVELLRLLPRRLEGVRLAVIGAFRPRSANTALGRTARYLGSIRLQELDSANAQQVARAIAGRDVSADSLRATGGNPFLVVEAARTIAAGHDVEPSRPLPDALRQAIVDRFNPEASGNVIRAAAVLGETFTAGDLARLVEHSLAETLDTVDAAMHSGVLLGTERGVRFPYDMLRQAVYESMVPDVRRLLHRRVAEQALARGAPLDEVAKHEAAAADGPDRQSFDRVMAVYRKVSGLSFPTETVPLLQLAIDVAPDIPARDAATAMLANHLYRYGEAHRVEELVRPIILRATDPSVRGWAHHALACALIVRDQVPQAAAELERIVTDASLPDDVRTWSRAVFANCLVRQGDRGAIEFARQVAADAAELARDDPPLLAAACQALLAVVDGSLGLGAVGDAVHAGRQAAEAEVRAPGTANMSMSSYSLGIALSVSDNHDEAVAVLESGRRRCEEAGVVMSLPSYHFALAMEQYRAGGLEAAAGHAETGLSLVTKAELRRGTYLGYGILARTCAHFGDTHRAERVLEQGFNDLERFGPSAFLEWLLWAAAVIRGTGAHEVWEHQRVSGLGPSFRVITADLVRVAIGEGDWTTAERITRATARIADADEPSARAAAVRCRGLYSGDTEHFVEAIRHLEHVRRPMETAAAAEEGAFAATRSGDDELARQLLEQAADVYGRVGATADADRAHRELDRLAGRRPRRRGRDRPAFGWEALTDSELAVVRLVATGLTNRAIADELCVARSTVQTHLANAFAKLGCNSRAQVAAIVARRDEEDPRHGPAGSSSPHLGTQRS